MITERSSNPAEILSQTRVEVAPETFFLISLTHNDWLKLLENPELSPRMTAPFMIFRDKWEVTLLVDKIDFNVIRHAIRDAKTEGNFRLLTFNIELDFNVVGFLAEVSRILAEAEISIVALSAFSRDHLLIKQEDLPKALKVLSKYVAELC
ncbi:MAG TPA: ACT domain-containing protein [Pyrinomonadaceae bacterium]|nr:ACT domain-containing protein [Pyrinomonadaceae bacterium]